MNIYRITREERQSKVQTLSERWIYIGRKQVFLTVSILVMALVCGGLIRNRMAVDAKNPAVQDAGEVQETKEKKAEKEAEGETEEEKEIRAVEASIVPGQYPIMGASSITAEQMVSYFSESREVYPAEVLERGGAPDIETFCRIYCEEATAEGVRPEVAFAQTMKETGWLQYGGDASIEQYNFAGLGTTGGGVPGNSYPDVRTGVRAQIQHLKAYATDETLAGICVDDRYEYVTKGSAPYVEWLGQKENPKGYGWATGENYGYDIVKMIQEMRSL